MVRAALASLFILLALAPVGLARADASAPVPPVPPVPSVAVKVTRLANGLEVVLHEDHRAPLATVNVWYHVGSKDEPPGKSGFAHLFEHVMFQGSKHVPEDTYVRYLERAGATDVNGTTHTDRTAYYETVPSNRLELALWLESDRMGFLLPHVDGQTFAVQRDVVKNERRQNFEGVPYGLVPSLIREAMYPPGHPYHEPAMGNGHDLDAATVADVRTFFKTWYVPGNATLVIAGDIDPARTMALVEKYFGPIVSHAVPVRKAGPAPVLKGDTHLDVHAGVELARLYLTWSTPGFFAAGDAELDLLARVLAGGKTSRLYKRLVYERRIAEDLSAAQSSSESGSMFEIVATAQPGHTPAELLAAIDEELERLRRDGLTDAELARAQTALVSGRILDLERGATRANLINLYAHYMHRPDFFADDVARYRAVTAAGLRDAAVRWLPAHGRIVTVVTPATGAPVGGEVVGTTPGAR